MGLFNSLICLKCVCPIAHPHGIKMHREQVLNSFRDFRRRFQHIVQNLFSGGEIVGTEAKFEYLIKDGKGLDFPMKGTEFAV